MSRFKLSRQAEQDLEDIWTYVAEESEQAAEALIDAIIRRFPKLATFPEMGKRRDDLLEGLRSFPVKSYVLFYRMSEEEVEIFRILITRGKKLNALKEVFYLIPQAMPEVIIDPTTLNTLTAGELRDLAKKRGISGYSKKKKDELVELLSQ